MGKTTCCNCNKVLGITSLKFLKKELWEISSHPKVIAMSSDDRLCTNCKRMFDEELNPEQLNPEQRPFSRNPELASEQEETPTNIKVKAKESSGSIKFAYYGGLFSIIIGPVAILWGIMTESYWVLLIGSIGFMLGLVQYSSRKKKLDSLSKTENEPLSILKMRLAKGEITKEEFDKIRDDLE